MHIVRLAVTTRPHRRVSKGVSVVGTARLKKILLYQWNGLVPLWKSLPNDVVMADNIKLFEERLDKFWSSYDFVYRYLFRAQPLETGSVK